ncbi:MAG TPA: aldo/keto reductase [Lacibacter sp.]|nr:aldo/keto reductase [Lacibacter sp.]HMO88779.1 aldo/keto reductase [Lacibacter sp.]HMP87311.1 aldo/keto reductase [Lacibacter sp.]
MRYRKFGHTDLHVSEIGFGAWAIGGDAVVGTTPIGWGKTDDATSRAAIHAALDAGINFFDTADIYGLGHSEALLGETIGLRSDVIIATKVGNVARDNRFTVDYSAAHIVSACETSLRRLRRDTIDYYQLHTARFPHLQEGSCIEAMEQLQRQGKIRYWGLSLNTFEPEADAGFLMNQQKGNGFQLVLNLINQAALPLLRRAARQGYGIIARMPLQFGLLTGKFDKEARFEAADHRKRRLTPEVLAAAAEATAPLWQLCEKYNCTRTQLALSYVCSYEEVSVVIPGIRTPEQVAANTSGLFQLEATDREWIESLGSTAFIPLMQLIREQG